MTICKRCGERNPAEIHTCSPLPDCRNCVEFSEFSEFESPGNRCLLPPPLVCIGGDAFAHADPVRLYKARKGEGE